MDAVDVKSKTGLEGRHDNFAQDPLHSYSDEQQKNEIHLLYLYFVFTSFLFIICEVLE